VLDRRVVIDIWHVGRGNLDIDIIRRGDRRVFDRLGASAATDAGRFGRCRRSRGGRSRRSRSCSASPTRRWRGLLLGADPFLTLPARADASDLVVSE
jgi:hypothetical protein